MQPARSALKTLNGFTSRELAAAIGSDGSIDAASPTDRAIVAAIGTQK
jgi:hypothetical protein